MVLYRNAPWFFLLALLTAFAGFYPSYFARLPQTDFAHHFHGISATAWLVLLITQSWLMRTRRLSLHRTLGRLSPIVVIAFVGSGALMMRTMLTNTDGFSQHFGVRLAFLDLTSTLYFVLAYGLALHYRRSLHLHARFMASTALLVIPPAVSRFLGNYVPGVDSFELAMNGAYFIVEGITLILIVQDARSGRVQVPYVMLLVLFVLQHALVGQVSEASWWLPVAALIRGG